MKFNITIKDGTFVYYKSKWKSWYKITLSEKCAVLCCSVVSDSLRLHELYPALYSMDSLLSPCDSSGKNWSELPFSSPGDPPDPGMDHWVSCLAGKFFTIWAIREVQVKTSLSSDFLNIDYRYVKKNSPTTIKLRRDYSVLLHRRVRSECESLLLWCLCFVSHYKIG